MSLITSSGRAFQIARRAGIRKPELENILRTSAGIAYLYARDVLHDRWLIAEPIILSDPWVAYCYARDVIKGRWPEAEIVVKKNKRAELEYQKNIASKHPWELPHQYTIATYL